MPGVASLSGCWCHLTVKPLEYSQNVKMADQDGKETSWTKFHYTDKTRWNAIRSQVVWLFNVSQPKDPDRPAGAYFTDLEPSAVNLRLLFKKIRVPRDKQEFVFIFTGTEGLRRLFNGTGRDKHIFFSPIDYLVPHERQVYDGLTQRANERQS